MNNFIKTLFLSITLSIFLPSNSQNKYWVKFKDKNGTPYSVSTPSAYLSQKSIQRRTTYNIPINQSDLPCTPSYVSSVDAVSGVTVMYASKWINGVVVSLTNTTALTTINSFSFVASSAPVTRLKVNFPDKSLFVSNGQNRSISGFSASYYGGSYAQCQQLGVDCIHNKGYRGQGMTIAVLDAGFFRADINRAFDSLRNRGGILGTRDFVTGGTSVYEDDSHGEMVLSCMAAIIPDTILGTAPRANYWLLRTEDANTETPSEEYNWIRGAEFADSAGADILTTSLGYTEFDNPAYNHNYAGLNGKTYNMSIAATMAARKGMFVLNAAGNEASNNWHYISVPADADSICTVGAIDYNSNVASFSSVGPTSDGRVKPDLTARGVGSWVMDPGSGMPGGGNGTSFATPILAGAVACLWQALPSFNNMRILDTLKKSANNRWFPNNSRGWGTPNVCFALTSVQEQHQSSFELKVMPNPFSHIISLRFPNSFSLQKQVSITNSLGALVYSSSIKTSGEEFSIDLSELSAGIYFLKVESAEGSVTKKLVKN